MKAVLGIVAGWTVITTAGCGAGQAVTERPADPTWASVLRTARSEDGLSFVGTGKVFMPHAAAPDLVRLPKGDLLALFDYAANRHANTPPVLLMSRSQDEGRSWSVARVVKLRGKRDGLIAGYHGDLLSASDGTLRLYFAAERDSRPAEDGKKPATLIRCALTRDGLEYRVDERTRVPVASGSYLHPTVARVGDLVHLFADGLHHHGSSSAASEQAASHFISRDGRRFVGPADPLAGPLTSDVSFVGSIVRSKAGLRAYVSSESGVRSLVSRDARTWRAESGLRMPRAWDPAVVRLKDGSYLMVYCAALDDATAADSVAINEPVGSPKSMADASDRASGTTSGCVEATGEAAAGEAATTNELQALVAPPSDAELALIAQALGPANDHGASWDAVARTQSEDSFAQIPPADENGWNDAGALGESVEAGLPPELVSDSELEEWLARHPLMDEDGFVRLPDFLHKIDYVQWWRDNFVERSDDDAYPVYGAFMPGLPGTEESETQWPALNNMFTDEGYSAPPGPWDPAENANWAASSDAAGHLLAQFRDATLHEGYSYPADDALEALTTDAEAAPILFNLPLPQLSRFRDLNKATLADAWRMEEGQVSSSRMLEAWETCFRNAEHLNHGPTLIEELVSTADRALVHENARWALQHGVFSADQLETALDVLTDYDPGNPDPLRAVHGEHASTMDFMQWAFWPEEPGGEPVFREERCRQVLDLSEHTYAELHRLTSQDVSDALDTFDAYHRELSRHMSVGYPEARAGDVWAAAEARLDTNALTRLLLPNLSRVHTLRTRVEASRRATQLAYATHLFKSRYGRWPETLDELPPEHGYEMLTDPFTADYFGYRLTDGGPTIYSLSENGLDDDGVHAERWADEPTESESDDHVFWPPQAAR
ncbi:MAG: sialidase family protein [Planctomycetota bacterium]|jgi:hypothetical protein